MFPVVHILIGIADPKSFPSRWPERVTSITGVTSGWFQAASDWARPHEPARLECLESVSHGAPAEKAISLHAVCAMQGQSLRVEGCFVLHWSCEMKVTKHCPTVGSKSSAT